MLTITVTQNSKDSWDVVIATESISTSSNMTTEDAIELVKETIKKNTHPAKMKLIDKG